MNWFFDDPAAVVTVVTLLLALSGLVWVVLMSLKRRRIKRELCEELDRIFGERYDE